MDVLAIAGKGECPDRTLERGAKISGNAPAGCFDHHDVALTVAHREHAAVGVCRERQNGTTFEREICNFGARFQRQNARRAIDGAICEPIVGRIAHQIVDAKTVIDELLDLSAGRNIP